MNSSRQLEIRCINDLYFYYKGMNRSRPINLNSLRHNIPDRLKTLNPTKDNIMKFDRNIIEQLSYYGLISTELHLYYIAREKTKGIIMPTEDNILILKASTVEELKFYNLISDKLYKFYIRYQK